MADTRLDDVFAKICGMEAPLSVRLHAFAQALSDLGLPSAKAYEDLVSKLTASGEQRKTPGIGDTLPDFMLPDHNGRLVGLHELLEAGPLVLSFNRGHWCQFCELELQAFTRSHLEIAGLGATVASVMPERREFIRQVWNKANGKLITLSDMDNSYALELGLAVWVGDEIRDLYTGIGLDLERYQGNGMWFVPIPATFVIKPSGIIVARYVDPDFRKRMETEQVVDALRLATVP
jgi:peroxiredoxin